MKKIVAVMIIVAGVLMLSACGGSGDKSAAPVSKNPGDVYRVVTVDESGAPVEGVMVQFCSDQMCQMGETDSDGIAAFKSDEGSYTVHVYDVPEGYAQDDTEYTAPETYGDVTITIKAAG